MILFDYIFFRSYTKLVSTKHKQNAEPRSIALVTVLQGALIFSLILIIFKLFDFNINIQVIKGGSLKYLISLPLVFLIWYLNESYYKKKSKDGYKILRNKYKNSVWNRLIPFWLIFLTPFLLIFGIPLILSLIK